MFRAQEFEELVKRQQGPCLAAAVGDSVVGCPDLMGNRAGPRQEFAFNLEAEATGAFSPPTPCSPRWPPRGMISQAKGVIMERFQIDPFAAFALLTKLSHDSDTPVRTIAHQIAESLKTPGSNGLTDIDSGTVLPEGMQVDMQVPSSPLTV